ncbi:MAG: amidohydrolase [Myxococcales bacterium]|nr:amidohydrolase [Myxococcales bacterium]
MAAALASSVALVVASCGSTATAPSVIPRPAPVPSEPPPEPPPLPWEQPPASPPPIDSPLIAIVGGTVMTAAGETFVDGVVIMEDGRLVAVGPRDRTPIPQGARRVDATGRWVTPGLIDAHSHVGVYAVPALRATADGNEATNPVTAHVWAGDSFWPQDPAISRLLAAGVTTILVLPGSANLIGGRGVTLRLRPGRSVGEMLFHGAPDTLKMACGENPRRVYGERNTAPSTRMGNVAGYRAAFQGAAEYGRQWRDWQHQYRLWHQKRLRYERALDAGIAASPDGGVASPPDDPGPAPAPPARDFGKEALLGALEGRVLVQMHCYRADEMLRMIELGRQLGLRIRVFHHAVEAYKVRDVLAREGIGVATWADWWGFKLEAFDAIVENLALLTEAGVHAVLHSDSAQYAQRLGQEAGKALAAGRRAGVAIDEDQALRWITAEAAWALGIESRTGTLEPGKMADVVVWSGHPFSVYSHVDLVFLDGVLVYDRSRPDPSLVRDFELGLTEPAP